MVSANTLIKNALNVKHCVVDNYNFYQRPAGVVTLEVDLHPLKTYADRCPFCGKRCPVYDRNRYPKKWRALDFGGIIVELYACTQRINCKEHGVVVASVPWAFHDSSFTKDFDLTAT